MADVAGSTGNEFVLHSCDLCDYKTPKIAHFRKHQLKYHGAMPMKKLNWRKCRRCDAEFATRTEFAGHQAGCRIPCPSPGCAFSAPQPSKMVLHLNTVHRKPTMTEEEARMRAGQEAALRRLLRLRPRTTQQLVVEAN